MENENDKIKIVEGISQEMFKSEIFSDFFPSNKVFDENSVNEILFGDKKIELSLFDILEEISPPEVPLKRFTNIELNIEEEELEKLTLWKKAKRFNIWFAKISRNADPLLWKNKESNFSSKIIIDVLYLYGWRISYLEEMLCKGNEKKLFEFRPNKFDDTLEFKILRETLKKSKKIESNVSYEKKKETIDDNFSFLFKDYEGDKNDEENTARWIINKESWENITDSFFNFCLKSEIILENSKTKNLDSAKNLHLSRYGEKEKKNLINYFSHYEKYLLCCTLRISNLILLVDKYYEEKNILIKSSNHFNKISKIFPLLEKQICHLRCHLFFFAEIVYSELRLFLSLTFDKLFFSEDEEDVNFFKLASFSYYKKSLISERDLIKVESTNEITEEKKCVPKNFLNSISPEDRNKWNKITDRYKENCHYYVGDLEEFFDSFYQNFSKNMEENDEGLISLFSNGNNFEAIKRRLFIFFLEIPSKKFFSESIEFLGYVEYFSKLGEDLNENYEDKLKLKEFSNELKIKEEENKKLSDNLIILKDKIKYKENIEKEIENNYGLDFRYFNKYIDEIKKIDFVGLFYTFFPFIFLIFYIFYIYFFSSSKDIRDTKKKSNKKKQK